MVAFGYQQCSKIYCNSIPFWFHLLIIKMLDSITDGTVPETQSVKQAPLYAISNQFAFFSDLMFLNCSCMLCGLVSSVFIPTETSVWLCLVVAVHKALLTFNSLFKSCTVPPTFPAPPPPPSSSIGDKFFKEGTEATVKWNRRDKFLQNKWYHPHQKYFWAISYSYSTYLSIIEISQRKSQF